MPIKLCDHVLQLFAYVYNVVIRLLVGLVPPRTGPGASRPTFPAVVPTTDASDSQRVLHVDIAAHRNHLGGHRDPWEDAITFYPVLRARSGDGSGAGRGPARAAGALKQPRSSPPDSPEADGSSSDRPAGADGTSSKRLRSR